MTSSESKVARALAAEEQTLSDRAKVTCALGRSCLKPPHLTVFSVKFALALHLHRLRRRRNVMLWKIASILVVLWLLGVILHIAGSLIHFVLVAALVMFVIHLFTNRQGVA
jgi:hypothetical protein